MLQHIHILISQLFMISDTENWKMHKQVLWAPRLDYCRQGMTKLAWTNCETPLSQIPPDVKRKRNPTPVLRIKNEAEVFLWGKWVINFLSDQFPQKRASPSFAVCVASLLGSTTRLPRDLFGADLPSGKGVDIGDWQGWCLLLLADPREAKLLPEVDPLHMDLHTLVAVLQPWPELVRPRLWKYGLWEVLQVGFWT